MKTKKGITIVEVVISFTIALILIMSLYMIVYWGTNINTINNKIIRINNAMTFIQQDMLNNTPLYFELQSNGSIKPKPNINDIIRTRLQQFKLNDPIITNVTLVSFQRERINNSLQQFDNIYRVRIEIEWIHKGQNRRYQTDFLISDYSLKKISSSQDPVSTSLRINLPNNYYSPVIRETYVDGIPGVNLDTPSSPGTTSDLGTPSEPGTPSDPGGGFGGGGCFEKGTLIPVCKNGKILTKNIEDINEQDFVVSFHNNQIMPIKVEKLHAHEGEFQIVQIQTKSGLTFRATHNHPAIVNNCLRKFGKLQIGDYITILKDNQIITDQISNISTQIIKGKVYSIEIESNEKYCYNHFIGNNDAFMLVNCGMMKISKVLANLCVSTLSLITSIAIGTVVKTYGLPGGSQTK